MGPLATQHGGLDAFPPQTKSRKMISTHLLQWGHLDHLLFPNKAPYPSSRPARPLGRAQRLPRTNLRSLATPPPHLRPTAFLLPPGSGDVGGGRGRGVPRVPGRGGAAPQVADAREAAPGSATRRRTGRRGRVLGQHTRRLRGECLWECLWIRAFT